MSSERVALSAYERLQKQLIAQPRTWLVTGVAGFIGSHLLETLLRLDQHVVGMDNFATGHRRNLRDVQAHLSQRQWDNFRFLEGDIRSPADCTKACEGVDYVLHQAALGSIPRSLADPLATHEVNVTGFLNMLEAARHAKVQSFVYAASSSTYGDHVGLPKVENVIGRPLSPYAVTKYANELYAEVFGRCYDFDTIGLRYFNVFGKRQEPNGPYAAVIPVWTTALVLSQPVYINGDGESSRDFCYVANAVQANLLAAVTDRPEARNQIYNVAGGNRTTLNALFELLRGALSAHGRDTESQRVYRGFRAGDIRHSLADISKAKALLGYVPTHTIAEGLPQIVSWYLGMGDTVSGGEARSGGRSSRVASL